MADIFDRLAKEQQTPAGDIFDRLASEQPQGDIFDQIIAEQQTTEIPFTERTPSTGVEPVLEAARPLGVEIPIPRVLDEFLIRTGRRQQEAAEAQARVPQNITEIFAREEVEGKPAVSPLGAAVPLIGALESIPGFDTAKFLDTLRGAAAPFEFASAPFIATPVEQAAAPFLGEQGARIAGDIGEVITGLATGRAAASGKVSEAFKDVARLLGVEPGKLVEPPAVIRGDEAIDTINSMKKFFIEGVTERRTRIRQERLAREQIAFADAPRQVEAAADLDAMKQTSSLLDAASAQIRANPGNITLSAAKETSQGQIERVLPKPEDFFRTTQSEIERVTSALGPGNDTASALLRERDLMAEQIAREMAERKFLREAAPEMSSKVDSLHPSKAKAEILPEEQTTARRVFGSAVEEELRVMEQAREGFKLPGSTKTFIKGMAQQSTRQFAEMGPAGRLLGSAIQLADTKGERLAGQYKTIAEGLISSLTKAEQKNLPQVQNFGAAPLSSRVTFVANKIREMRSELATRANAGGIRVRNPITGEERALDPGLENYLPHYLPKELTDIFKSRKSTARLTEQVQQMLTRKRGQAVSIGEAKRVVDFMRENSHKRYGNLEISRMFDFPEWDDNALRVWSRYFDDVPRRIVEAEMFGHDYKRAEDLVELIRKTAGDEQAFYADAIVQRLSGKEVTNPIIKQFGPKVRSYQSFSKLAFAWIANLSQPVLNVVVGGLRNSLRAAPISFTERGTEFAKLAGTAMDSTMERLFREVGGGSLGQFTLRKATPFAIEERFNRIHATNTGAFLAEDVFQKLQKSLARGSRRADFYREKLEKMDIDVAAALGRGALSFDDLIKGGQWLNRKTQFATTIAELPIQWTGEAGKIVTQFKSFMFKATQTMKDEVAIPAGQWIRTGGRKGDIKPMIRLMIGGQIAGELVNQGQSLFTGRERPENIFVRMAENYAAMGAAAIFWTTALSLGIGTGAIASLVLGPTLFAPVEFSHALYRLFQGDTKPISKFALRSVPFGSAVASRAFPPQD